MGALTGGFFGDFLTQVVKLTTGGDFTLPALFTPLDDTLMILIGAMALGMVQIITGMAISFVRKLKKRSGDGRCMGRADLVGRVCRGSALWPPA